MLFASGLNVNHDRAPKRATTAAINLFPPKLDADRDAAATILI